MNLSHYDMILFENYHDAYHHKYDLVLIAKLLRYSGLNVALLDIYQEEMREEIEGIPVIHLQGIPRLNFGKGFNGNKILVSFRMCFFFIRRANYFKKVIKQIGNMADSFYCGSYNMWMSTAFMRLRKPCFYWGLRSSRMTFKISYIWHENPFAIRYLFIKKRFMQNPYQYLFVSNNFIREEFIKLGLPANRIIIREERCVENKTEFKTDRLSTKLRFLTIGNLRSDKQIVQTIKAFKNTNMLDSELYLVGSGEGNNFEKTIINEIGNDFRVHRVNRYLEYKDFYEQFSKTHFVVFADKQKISSITNGTMMEALINHRPIIAPNFNPFSYYVNKYHIGLLYKANDIASLSKTLELASNIGLEHFLPAINTFLKSIDFVKISQEITINVRRIINENHE